MAKALKRMLVSEYEKALEGVDGVIVLDPGPLTVENAQELRRDLREKAGGARLHVIHNRTGKRALASGLFEQKPEVLEDMLKGPTAIAFGGEGPIPIAKVLVDWRKKIRALRLKGGVAEGDVLGSADTAGLADLPGVPELRGMLLSALIGSGRGIASSLQAVYGGIARTLQARIDKEGGGESDS